MVDFATVNLRRIDEGSQFICLYPGMSTLSLEIILTDGYSAGEACTSRFAAFEENREARILECFVFVRTAEI